MGFHIFVKEKFDGVECVGELSSTAQKYEESATCHGRRIIRGLSRRHRQQCCKTRGGSYQPPNIDYTVFNVASTVKVRDIFLYSNVAVTVSFALSQWRNITTCRKWRQFPLNKNIAFRWLTQLFMFSLLFSLLSNQTIAVTTKYPPRSFLLGASSSLTLRTLVAIFLKFKKLNFFLIFLYWTITLLVFFWQNFF